MVQFKSMEFFFEGLQTGFTTLKRLQESKLKKMSSNNTQQKVYVLQKDLPDAKAGTELTWSDNYGGYEYVDNTGDGDGCLMFSKNVENNPEWFKEKQIPIEDKRICDEDIKSIARSYYSKLKIGIFFGENPKEIERDIEARVFDFYAGYKTALKQPIPNKSIQPLQEAVAPTLDRQDILNVEEGGKKYGKVPTGFFEQKDSIEDKSTPKLMWNKKAGIHNENCFCMAKGCQEYNPLNPEHKIV